MRKHISQILTVLVLTTSFLAQTEKKNPYLVDEFGILALDDLMARLDAAAYELHNDESCRLQIKVYGGIADSFSSPYARGSIIEGYFRNNRKLLPEKYSIEYCNVNKEELRTQIYVVPANEKFPKCEENLDIPAKTILFETSGFYSGFYSGDFTFVPIEDSAIELGFSSGEYSGAAFNVLKKMLENSPENKIYIISYLQVSYEENESGKKNKKRVDKKSIAEKLLQTAKNELIKLGFKTSQIELVEGGYTNNERKLEFWFVPKGGETPKPKSDYFPHTKN